MHCALFCPFSLGPARGNITSVQRISRNLHRQGCHVNLLPLDSPDLQARLRHLADDPPDLIHAFHAYHAGPTALDVARQLKVPYLITLTGSDLFDPALRDHPHTQQALAAAASVTCFDPIVAQSLLSHHPGMAGKLSVIPQGVEPLPAAPPVSRAADAFVILLPAALRPVKGIDRAIAELTPLVPSLPKLQLWVAGGVLDEAYAAAVRAAAGQHPWARLLGEIPCRTMGAYYAAADLVLNSSLFEGGMANALLEAMVSGRPVLAHDVAGNRSLIRDGETGWLYRSGDELRALVSRLSDQPLLLQRAGQAARMHVLEHCSPQQEAAQLLTLYRSLIF